MWFPHRPRRCWTTGRCCCPFFPWSDGPVTFSATSVSCLCSTPLSPHHHLPSWPVPRCYSQGHCIITVRALPDKRTCLNGGIVSPFQCTHTPDTNAVFKQRLDVGLSLLFASCSSCLAQPISRLHRLLQTRPHRPVRAASRQVVSCFVCLLT